MLCHSNGYLRRRNVTQYHDVIGFCLGRFLGLIGQLLTALYILGVAIQQVGSCLPSSPAVVACQDACCMPALLESFPTSFYIVHWSACNACLTCSSAYQRQDCRILPLGHKGRKPCIVSYQSCLQIVVCRLWQVPVPSMPLTRPTAKGEIPLMPPNVTIHHSHIGHSSTSRLCCMTVPHMPQPTVYHPHPYGYA